MGHDGTQGGITWGLSLLLRCKLDSSPSGIERGKLFLLYHRSVSRSTEWDPKSWGWGGGRGGGGSPNKP